MSEKSKTAVNISFPTLSVLGVTFLVLKLCNVINWSWWWVLLPFYIGPAILVVVLILLGLIALVGAWIDYRREKKGIWK